MNTTLTRDQFNTIIQNKTLTNIGAYIIPINIRGSDPTFNREIRNLRRHCGLPNLNKATIFHETVENGRERYRVDCFYDNKNNVDDYISGNMIGRLSFTLYVQ